MADILVITCPSGKQATHLLPLLYSKTRFHLRLAAHSSASAQSLQQAYPDAEVLSTDLTSLSDCQQLLRGAASVLHIGPSLHSREKEMGFNMVDAAVAETQRPGNVFQHFVFSSVLCTQLRNLMQHDLKSYIEERLFLSPLNWTILKPTNFMDAYPVQLLAAQTHPTIERLWQPATPNSVIALRDLAEASAKVLLEGATHYFAEYPLSSTAPVSDEAIVQAIGAAIGKDIAIRAPAFETGVTKLLAFLFGGRADQIYAVEQQRRQQGQTAADDAPIDATFALAAEGDVRGDLCRDEAERLVLFYNRRGLRGSPNVLRWLLGREPTTVDEWIQLQLVPDATAPARSGAALPS